MDPSLGAYSGNHLLLAVEPEFDPKAESAPLHVELANPHRTLAFAAVAARLAAAELQWQSK